MHYIRSILTIALASITLMPHSFVFAEDGECACGTTPKIIQTYYEFAQKTIGILGSDYEEKILSPGSPFVGQFGSKKINIKNKNLLQTLFNNQAARRKENLIFVNNTAKVLWKEVKDIGLAYSTEIVMKSIDSNINRDLDKLSKLDAEINNITLAIGRRGTGADTLEPEHKNKITQLIDNLSPQLFEEGYNINNASYNDMIDIINKLQRSFKDDIRRGTGQGLEKEIEDGSSKITITSKTRKEIKASYQCIREQKCNETGKKITNAFGKERGKAKKGFGESISQFTFGIKKLKKSFASKGGGKITSKEDEEIQKTLDEMKKSRKGRRGNEKNIKKFLNIKFRSNIVDDIKNLTKKKKRRTIKEEGEEEKIGEVAQKTSLNTVRIISLEEISETIEQDSKMIALQFSEDQTETITESIKTLKKTQEHIKNIESNHTTACNLQCQNKSGVCTAQ